MDESYDFLLPAEKVATTCLETAQKQTDTEPTQAQRDAGNYRKGVFNWQGLEIAIENPVGSTRSGVSKDGKPWSVTMLNFYGYIKGFKGADKDEVDVFGGNDLDSELVAVIDQNDPTTGKFDECKSIVGVRSEEDAKKLYEDNYSKGWKGFRQATLMTLPQFKNWLEHGDKKHPVDKDKFIKVGWALEKIAIKKDPSYDPKHKDECCPSCGARLERSDRATCNRCGKPWPEVKVAEDLANLAMRHVLENWDDLVKVAQAEGHEEDFFDACDELIVAWSEKVAELLPWGVRVDRFVDELKGNALPGLMSPQLLVGALGGAAVGGGARALRDKERRGSAIKHILGGAALGGLAGDLAGTAQSEYRDAGPRDLVSKTLKHSTPGYLAKSISQLWAGDKTAGAEEIIVKSVKAALKDLPNPSNAILDVWYDMDVEVGIINAGDWVDGDVLDKWKAALKPFCKKVIVEDECGGPGRGGEWIKVAALVAAADGGDLAHLKRIKVMSDQRNYRNKHEQLRTLMQQAPQDWLVDSEDGKFWGVTHVPTQFRFHVPRHLVPLELHPAPDMPFPAEEHDDMRQRLQQGQPTYTTRIDKERGKYKVGSRYKTPWGDRVTVDQSTPYEDLDSHPFQAELTDSWKQQLAGQPGEVLKLTKAADDPDDDSLSISMRIE